MADTRAVRNLREDISYAQRQLNTARRDGSCEKIGFWARRVNELLDKYPRTPQLEDRPQDTPGSYVTSIGTDGVGRTERVESVRYRSAQPAIWPRLTWWQPVVRRLTPSRWRKPLEPVRPHKPAEVTLSHEGPTEDVIARHQRMMTEMSKAVENLTRADAFRDRLRQRPLPVHEGQPHHPRQREPHPRR